MGKVDLLNNYGVEVENVLDFWGDMASYEESLKEFKDSLSDKLTNLEFYKNTSDYYKININGWKAGDKIALIETKVINAECYLPFNYNNYN